jgi:membrane protease YdiL (CAAX protease family)
VLVAAGILGLYHLWLRGPLLQAGTGARLTAKLRDFGAESPARYLLLGAFISIPHSLLEEYYWRWFAFGWLRLRLPVVLAVVISSLAFMAHHTLELAVCLPGQFFTLVVPFSLCIAGGGAVWAWLYQRTGSIYSAWFSHALIDVAIILVGYDLAFVSTGS